ncbi:Hsp70 family protein [Methyloglobulus sp.]|uniref:Hsp70 family protein n=1 Tax=Methyloglobulus sp. TaxID=2518622 RepID=UPI003988B1F0
MQYPQFHVGIDLGTTHTVVAYAKNDNQQDIQLLQIEQLIAPGQVAAKPLLPSVRYHPSENELPETEIIFAQPGTRAVIGEAARLLGSKTKGRLVTSAKSWLSHPSVDHSAEILPWGSTDGIEKVSPVAASASYLRHIRTVWGHHNPDALLEYQDIVITVPASFDEAARSLTLEAAKMAGLNNVRLLEEPQAVCYDWLRRHTDNVHNVLANIRLLLICDIGGGTTDLTLIKVEHNQPEPKLTRIAVGDHIMLGGDNIDLALAHLVENRLHTDQSRLSAADLSFVIEQCRAAKERLLAEDAPEQLTITLLGGGSKLIGGSRSTVLTQEEVRRIALDGFFPLTKLDDLPNKRRSGVVEFGLPYTAEPAVSKHIAAFLNLHKEASQEALQGTSSVPDAILLNGGLFRSQAITQRLLELCNSWNSKPLQILENNHPEFSVAYGAVSYAISRRDKKLKIGGGAARSYFLLVDTAPAKQESKPQSPPRYGICVLPKGSEEGEEIILHERRFVLRTGIPVRFDLVSHSGDNACKPGDIAEITDDFHILPPLVVAFDDKVANNDKETDVQLGVTQTDLGTLKIQCIAVDNAKQQRWDVEFQIRKQGNIRTQVGAELPPQFNAVSDQIQAVFGPKSKEVDPNAVKNLRADMEKLLGRDRSEWDSSLLRALFSVLWEGHKYRRRSGHHERVWLSLTGFCLRPGFGCPLDDWRIEQLWKIYLQGIQFSNEIQNWSEWWTLWRRIAGGLGAAAQELIFADTTNYINPASSRQPSIVKQLRQRSYDNIVQLAAVLERLSVTSKIQLGEWLLKRLEKANEPKQTWWALGRVAARIPFYGSSHNVIPADIAGKWLATLLTQDWKKTPQAAFAATLICRKSGDRVRDIDGLLRMQIMDKLKSSKMPYPWLDMVEHHKELDEKETDQFFGEALPPGLKLIHTDLET